MGKWEELQDEMASMSAEQKQKTLDGLKEICFCIDCPTNATCSQEVKQTLFCFIGKYDCELTMKGCLCPACPVKQSSGLAKFYYCIRGNEESQRKV
jgi:hypothetical protein